MPNVDDLLARACERTRLADFGDPSFREGLDQLVASLEGEANLTPMGQAMADNALMNALSNRLQVEAWWSAHPGLEDEVIDRPIVIVGMSRSGTTALSHLLGLDEGLRSLRRWESQSSVPPPEVGTYWTDTRYLASIEADALSEAALPGLKALHHDPAEAPVECNSLLAHAFNSTVFPTVYFVPTCFRWMMDTDQSAAYDYHERMLKLLQSKAPGRWNLKGPQHGYALDTLRRKYPNATLIVTHRDPAVCTASTASLMSFLHKVTSAGFDPVAVGTVTNEFIERCADGLVADHRLHGPGGMIHVQYPDLVADPLRTVRRVYAELDRELTPETERAMTAHVTNRPQHKHGVHRYSPQDFGLSRGDLDERFARYRETFGVALERAGADPSAGTN